MCFKVYGHLFGLYDSLFTLHLIVANFGAKLDKGGWLDLALQGLSPCKKCQALLGVQMAYVNAPLASFEQNY